MPFSKILLSSLTREMETYLGRRTLHQGNFDLSTTSTLKLANKTCSIQFHILSAFGKRVALLIFDIKSVGFPIDFSFPSVWTAQINFHHSRITQLIA